MSLLNLAHLMIIHVIFSNIDVCWGVKVLLFQENNELTTDSVAKLDLQDQPGHITSDISVCHWLKVKYFRKSTYVYSYATSDKDNNELNMGVKQNLVYAAIGGSYEYGNKNETIIPNIWFHSCFSVNSTSEKVDIYFNGKYTNSQDLSKRSILLNGTISLGQEADLWQGGYNEHQSFSGYITHFNIYNRTLLAAEVNLMWACSAEAIEGDIVAWSSAKWDISGPVTELELDQDEICSLNQFVATVFPEKRSWEPAHRFCQDLKMHMAVPHSDEDNDQLYAQGLPFAGTCQPPNHSKGFMWVGATSKGHPGNWTDMSHKPLNFTNFNEKATSKKQIAAGYKIPPENAFWDDLSVSKSYKFCVPCEEVNPVILYMRGLCEEDLKAAWFRMKTNSPQETRKPSFRGYTKYEIDLINGNTWHLTNMWLNKTIAVYFAHDGRYPFGINDWNITEDYEICEKESGVSHKLSLSACYSWEYTCSDGSCVNMTQRCDLRVDCPDSSDETDCGKLLRPSEYLSTLPPPSLVDGALPLNLTVTVEGFSEINIRDMKLTIDFSTNISWFDQRLQYQNLRSLADLNQIEPSSVWNPTIEFVNADFPYIYKTDPILVVNRSVEPLPDDPKLFRRDDIYEGKVNQLSILRKINAPFSCKMDMLFFPFDTQYCKLQIKLISARQEFLIWENLTVYYFGEVALTEYMVGKLRIEPGIDRDYSLATVHITLYRRFWFYITSAFVPTVMLMFISYASLFCSKENRDLRVMMSITTLLVLYALYQQISDNLPRTSYTKAVDVWCFFAITFIFSQVVLHVAVDIDWGIPRRLRTRPYPSIKEITADESKCSPKKIMKKVDGMVVARYAYALTFLIFCIIYWAVVLANMQFA